jgi:hypothetical protein
MRLLKRQTTTSGACRNYWMRKINSNEPCLGGFRVLNLCPLMKTMRDCVYANKWTHYAQCYNGEDIQNCYNSRGPVDVALIAFGCLGNQFHHLTGGDMEKSESIPAFVKGQYYAAPFHTAGE